MGRPKLALSMADRLEHRKKQNRESQAKYRSMKSKELLATQRWSRRQRHPESVKKDLQHRKVLTDKVKAIGRAKMAASAKIDIRNQAKESGMKRFIKRLIRA